MAEVSSLYKEISKITEERIRNRREEEIRQPLKVSETVHLFAEYQEVLDAQSGEEAWPDYLNLIKHIKAFMHDTNTEVLENITVNGLYEGGWFPIKEKRGDIYIVSEKLTFSTHERHYNLEEVADVSELLLGQKMSLQETNGRTIRRFLKTRLSTAVISQYEI